MGRPPFIRRQKKRDKAAVSAVWGIKYLFCLIKSIQSEKIFKTKHNVWLRPSESAASKKLKPDFGTAKTSRFALECAFFVKAV